MVQILVSNGTPQEVICPPYQAILRAPRELVGRTLSQGLPPGAKVIGRHCVCLRIAADAQQSDRARVGVVAVEQDGASER